MGRMFMQKKFLGFIVLIIISAGLIGCSIMGKNKADAEDISTDKEMEAVGNIEKINQKLIDDDAEKTDRKDVVAAALVHTPENCDCQHHKYDLAAAFGDGLHQNVKRGNADRLQQTKKAHSVLLIHSFS